jgi:hypothetical protein
MITDTRINQRQNVVASKFLDAHSDEETTMLGGQNSSVLGNIVQSKNIVSGLLCEATGMVLLWEQTEQSASHQERHAIVWDVSRQFGFAQSNTLISIDDLPSRSSIKVTFEDGSENVTLTSKEDKDGGTAIQSHDSQSKINVDRINLIRKLIKPGLLVEEDARLNLLTEMIKKLDPVIKTEHINHLEKIPNKAIKLKKLSKRISEKYDL